MPSRPDMGGGEPPSRFVETAFKEWLDFEPVAGWSDAEKLAAVKAQQALSILDPDKALFLLPLFAEQFEATKAAWDRAQQGPRDAAQPESE